MRKMDEMERLHSLYAMKAVFVFSMLFELGYLIVESIKANRFIAKDNIVFFLLICQGIVLFISSLLMKSKVGDEKSKYSILIGVIIAVVAVFVGWKVV